MSGTNRSAQGRRERGRRSAVRGLVGLAGVLALLVSGLAQALGLGQATVRSYYQQPLDVRIDLISRSEAEMATVTASLASPADFQVVGLNRSAISMPLEFTVNRDLADPHIRVTSTQPVNDPVLQLVVEVVWSSGRMLKQYTLFLDPPAFDAPAPLPDTSGRARPAPDIGAVSAPESRTTPFAEETPAPAPLPEPTPAPAPREATPPVSDPGPPFDPLPDARDAASRSAEAAPPPGEREASEDSAPETIAEAPTAALAPDSSGPTEPTEAAPALAQAGTPEAPGAAPNRDPVTEPESESASLDPGPEQAPEPEAETEPVPEPVDIVYRAVLPDPGQPQPASIDVVRGDTLWGLSRRYAEAQGVSINQVMLAVQQKNPSAFIDGNINALMAGEVLRMPDRDEVRRFSARDAMLEVLRQEELYRTRWDIPASPDDIPTVANLAQAAPEGDAGASSPTEAPVADEDSRLELVPPSDGDEAGTEALGQGSSDDTGVSSGESVVRELARTQEELANARQENEYLAERIAELEAELARGEADAEGVEDTNLAELEERLREERLADEPEPEVSVTPPGESEHWLARYGAWLLALGVLAVAGVVWFLRSRRTVAFVEPRHDDPDTEIPEFDDDEYVTPNAEPVPDEGPVGGTEDDEATRIQPPPEEPEFHDPHDPETRLNLARAYLAMGNTKAVRDLLEEVLESGDEAQVREAREMLDEL